MTTSTISDLRTALVTALQADHRVKATSTTPDTYDHCDVHDMATAGLTSAEMHPALNMAVKSPLGRDMEEARHTGIQAARAATSQRRTAESRARAKRRADIEALDNGGAVSPDSLDPARMHDAWLVVMPLMPTIQRIADSKRVWASRYLGDAVTDVPQNAMLRMATTLAASDLDLDALHEAAEHIGDQQRTTGAIPTHQDDVPLSKDERREVKALRRNRKWLMAVVNNRVTAALVDAYREQERLPDSLDVRETIMATINQPGDDPLFNAHKASRAPSFLGTRFQAPDGIDSGVLATGITGAITDRGLDGMADFLLAEVEAHGKVRWADVAEQVFLLTPGGLGEWLWQQVERATSAYVDGVWQPIDRARQARGSAAKAHVRNLFEYLPGVITGLVEAMDYEFIGYCHEHQGRAILNSWFDVFLGKRPGEEVGPRRMLQPALAFISFDEAAKALLDGMGSVVSQSDLLGAALAS